VHQNYSEVDMSDLDFLKKRPDVLLLQSDSIGLSASRNIGISACRGNIVQICDDDVEISLDYLTSLSRIFAETGADIITAKFLLSSGIYLKKYSKKRFRHNLFTIGKVSSVEIAFVREKVTKSNIYFDEEFGLGTKYPGGEEYLFLLACKRNRLNIQFVPEIVCKHPIVTSGSNFYKNRAAIVAKRKVLERAFPKLYIVLVFFFWIKKSKFVMLNGRRNFLQFTCDLFFRDF